MLGAIKSVEVSRSSAIHRQNRIIGLFFQNRPIVIGHRPIVFNHFYGEQCNKKIEIQIFGVETRNAFSPFWTVSFIISCLHYILILQDLIKFRSLVSSTLLILGSVLI